MKKRIKQYSFWTGLSAALVILIGSIAKAFGFHFKEEIVSEIIMAICGVLVVLGVVNAPFKEDEETDKKDQTAKEEKPEQETEQEESKDDDTELL